MEAWWAETLCDLCKCFSCSLDPPLSGSSTSQIDNLFSMVCSLTDHKNDITMSKLKWNHKLQFHLKMVHLSTGHGKLLSICFFNNNAFHFHWSFSETFAREKEKTNFATITSFPWSVLLWARALNQSLHEKSLSYYKNILWTRGPKSVNLQGKFAMRQTLFNPGELGDRSFGFRFFPRLPFRSYSFRLQNETSASHLYTSFFQPWQEKVWYTCVYLRRRSLSFWWSVGSMSRRRNDRKS